MENRAVSGQTPANTNAVEYLHQQQRQLALMLQQQAQQQRQQLQLQHQNLALQQHTAHPNHPALHYMNQHQHRINRNQHQGNKRKWQAIGQTPLAVAATPTATTPANKETTTLPNHRATSYGNKGKNHLNPNATPTQSTQSQTKMGGSLQISSGSPKEPLGEGFGEWPKGWTKIAKKRLGGATTGRVDSYWISPIKKVRLRSLTEVRKFMKALQTNGGNEELAKRIVKRKKQSLAQTANEGQQIAGQTKAPVQPLHMQPLYVQPRASLLPATSFPAAPQHAVVPAAKHSSLVARRNKVSLATTAAAVVAPTKLHPAVSPLGIFPNATATASGNAVKVSKAATTHPAGKSTPNSGISTNNASSRGSGGVAPPWKQKSSLSVEEQARVLSKTKKNCQNKDPIQAPKVAVAMTANLSELMVLSQNNADTTVIAKLQNKQQQQQGQQQLPKQQLPLQLPQQNYSMTSNPVAQGHPMKCPASTNTVPPPPPAQAVITQNKGTSVLSEDSEESSDDIEFPEYHVVL